jgi:hypothetical protein
MIRSKPLTCLFAFTCTSLFLNVQLGCRGYQYGHLLKNNQSDMVGSHAAGSEVYNPLVEEAVGRLLSSCESTPVVSDDPNGKFEAVSRRMVDSALIETRLRPDSLLVPGNMQLFSSVLQRQGQPIDYLLYATLTSGTTERNSSSQRNYLLTMELVDTRTGSYKKEQAEIRKGYHKSPFGKLANYSLWPKAGR